MNSNVIKDAYRRTVEQFKKEIVRELNREGVPVTDIEIERRLKHKMKNLYF